MPMWTTERIGLPVAPVLTPERMAWAKAFMASSVASTSAETGSPCALKSEPFGAQFLLHASESFCRRSPQEGARGGIENLLHEVVRRRVADVENDPRHSGLEVNELFRRIDDNEPLVQADVVDDGQPVVVARNVDRLVSTGKEEEKKGDGRLPACQAGWKPAVP